MQKLDGVEDLRIRRTRKLLQQALIEGTVEKGFAALTVRDITERAMVNRSTFYRHYLDKYDLLEQHLNEIYETLEEGGGIIGEDRHEGLIELLKQIQQFPDFYRVMLGAQADAFLSQRFRQQTQQRFLAYFHQTFPDATSDPDIPPLDLKFTAIASAGCSALAWWLEQKRPSTPEQFAHWLQQLIYDISVSTLKPKKRTDRNRQ
ncbi:MAG TPA: TetR/AcrR family transcriptional regulator [Ktedonobacteraceae bacterium]|nr:TetR/AcrR family transcriptional regulator [Ktedonobacteraceae bacterium]